MSLAFEQFTPAGQEEISQRDYFFELYQQELAKGKSVLEARQFALEESRQFQTAKAEAINQGLTPSQATVAAQQVAEQDQDLETAVVRTQTSSKAINTVKSGAITLERFIKDNLIPVVLGAIAVLALAVFLIFTKSGRNMVRTVATGAPVKRG